jgi:hypothetical protein
MGGWLRVAGCWRLAVSCWQRWPCSILDAAQGMGLYCMPVRGQQDERIPLKQKSSGSCTLIDHQRYEMISESHYWKDDLLRQAQQLRRRMVQKRWTEISSAHVERSVMIGFYAVRKLIEAKKLSDNVANQNLRITTHPARGEAVTQRNRVNYAELYDLNQRRTVVRSLAFLCNQVIHSYLFALSFDESCCFNGILVASDRERNQTLYFVESQQIIELFEQIGNDYPDAMRLEFDSSIQDYKIQSRTRSQT